MEIKPQDLRLGNLIGVDDEVASVTAIGKISIYFTRTSGRRGSEHLTSISGIELTPEWLERFGFKRTQIYENVDEWYKKPLSLQTDQEIFMVTRIGTDDLELKHVHQLQNLFYSLTGEELAIDKTSLKN